MTGRVSGFEESGPDEQSCCRRGPAQSGSRLAVETPFAALLNGFVEAFSSALLARAGGRLRLVRWKAVSMAALWLVAVVGLKLAACSKGVKCGRSEKDVVMALRLLVEMERRTCTPLDDGSGPRGDGGSSLPWSATATRSVLSSGGLPSTGARLVEDGSGTDDQEEEDRGWPADRREEEDEDDEEEETAEEERAAGEASMAGGKAD